MSVREDLKDLEFPSDSLERIELSIELEDKYDITLTDSELAEITDREDLINLIENKLK
jgi:acyl carrier protein